MIVGMQVLTAAVNILDVAFGTNLTDPDFQHLLHETALGPWAVVLWGLLVIVASLWLLSLRRTGWALMMLLVGLALAVHLAIWWTDPERTAWMRLARAVLTAF
jgi:hypothetical protein